MICVILSPNSGLDAFKARGDFVGVRAGAASGITAHEVSICDSFVPSVRGSVLRGACRGDGGSDKDEQGEF